MTESAISLESIAQLVQNRDALRVLQAEAAERVSMAEDAASNVGNIDQRSKAILKAQFDDAERHERDVDARMEEICSEILTRAPSCYDDLILQAQTLAFIVDQDAICWDLANFKKEVATFASQLAAWASGRTRVGA